MGEIDTKPIESVRAALSLFEEKTDHLKTRVSGTDVSDLTLYVYTWTA